MAIFHLNVYIIFFFFLESLKLIFHQATFSNYSQMNREAGSYFTLCKSTTNFYILTPSFFPFFNTDFDIPLLKHDAHSKFVVSQKQRFICAFIYLLYAYTNIAMHNPY